VGKKKITLTKGQLDLGGIGKGYAIDALAEYLQTTHQFSYFLINGGGDIYATSDNGRSVTVTLVHPTNQTQGIGVAELHNQGFAASSPYVRSWRDRKTGKAYNHLHSDSPVASYVLAPTASSADIWATTSAVEPDVVTPADVQLLLIKEDKVLRTAEQFDIFT